MNIRRFLLYHFLLMNLGFDIRKDATGGGGTLSSNSMKIMGVIGMDVYFSEYPSSEEK
jgi:hypothetical protein